VKFRNLLVVHVHHSVIVVHLALTALVTKVVVIAHSAAHVVHRVTVTIVRHVMVALAPVASSAAIVNSI
jgi:hypothetical protein